MFIVILQAQLVILGLDWALDGSTMYVWLASLATLTHEIETKE